jgi:N-sulfoglucosamine sulfohydrolase
VSIAAKDQCRRDQSTLCANLLPVPDRLPNILYLHSHDTGRYVQPYGFGVSTPNIQRLAEEGMLFRQAFCAASTCSASRACLLTGQYAHTNGMLGLAHRGWSLNDYNHHVVHTLHEVGYHSVLIGEQHISKRPDVIGYDRVIRIGTTRASDVAPVTIDVLRDPPHRPLFLSVGFFETHREFFRAGAGEENYVLPPPNLPDTPETRRDMAAFCASARSLDEGVGAVLRAVDEFGFRDDTLVICTTDHGIAFPGAKATLTDRGIGVFLILRGPRGLTGGRACDALTSHIDIFPTICDLLDIGRPSFLQGESLMPLVTGEREAVRDEIFAEGTFHAAYEPQRAVRTPRWKYVRRFDDRRLPVLANIDDSPSKEVWLASGWGDRPVDREQLYDLFVDPNEALNVAGDPAAAEMKNELAGKLEGWMQRTDDPLLRGPVEPPPGAAFNDPFQVSPGEPTRMVNPS